MRPITKGIVIGGAIGLAVSTLALVLYKASTEPGSNGQAVPIVIGATAVGAIVGAAIGAGWEPRPEKQG